MLAAARRLPQALLLLTFALAGTAAWADKAAPTGGEGAPTPPPRPSIRSLALAPDSLTLLDARDSRKVLVTGLAADGRAFDLTAEASFAPDSDVVAVDEDGYVTPLRAGATSVTVTAAGRRASVPVTVKSADTPPVGFVRNIMPILGKSGCNAGTCHGSAQGRNGFKLSLRGYDSDFDYRALVFDLAGRRIDRVVPEESLMVLKPTAQAPHEGKQAVKPGSRHHRLLVQWIAEGAKPEDVSARAQSIEILPAAVEIDAAGRTQQFAVLAHYADGSVRDVTREAIVTGSDTTILAVQGNAATALRRGEAAALVRYEGNYATRLVTVMGDRTGFAWADPPEHNAIDRLAAAKWKRMKILPSELCTDDEFHRRARLDLTGLPPTPEQARAFLADPAPSREKRERVIDELIGSPAYIEHWTNKWTDLLQCNSEALGKKGVQVFRDWIRQAIAENRPYDRFVRELLLARGSAYRDPATNYYRVLREPGKIAEDLTQTFLGVRFNCTKCHDHPFENWTQRQYYQTGAYFAQLGIKRGTLGQDIVNNFTGDPVQVAGEEIVYRKYDGGEVRHPRTDAVVTPQVPFGSARDTAGLADPREPYVEWLTSPQNRLFAKSMANRTWSYFFGRGIIEPVDDIRTSNPPSNPELLEALTEDFVKGGFDVRRLMRAICRSRTYQLSIRTHRWNEDDRINFSHAIPRRLMAEQLLDALAVATGTPTRFGGRPKGTRAAELADGLVDESFLVLFGRPKRKSACECERNTAQITLAHTMNLINGRTIAASIAMPGNRIARLAETETDYGKVIEELYFAFLGRPPTDEERSAVALPANASPLDAAQDLAWALVNSPAFLFNR